MMGPTLNSVERNQRLTNCKPRRFASWCASVIILVSVTFVAGCGGNSPAGNGPLAVRVSLSPQTAQVALLGQTQFTPTVTGGSGGVTWSVNGAAGGSIVAGVISSSGLYTAPTSLPSPNTVTVTAASVDNPAQSASATVTIVNPQPVISSVSPSLIPLGSGDTKLTVNGSGFANGSVVQVAGMALRTLYWNPTALTATIPASALAASGTLPILVATPGPGGGASSTVNFTVMPGVFATNHPQVAMYAYAAPQAASVSVEYGTDTAYGMHTWAQNIPAGGGAVQILVAGMKANTTYHMRADAAYADGTQAVDQDRTFTTGGPPTSRVPQILVTNPNGLTPTPGAVFFHLTAGASNQFRAVVADNAGNVIWYYDYPAGLGIPQPMKLLPNGHMLLNLTPGVAPGGTVREIDLAGNLVSQYTVADLKNWLSAAGYSFPVFAIHHDVLPLPDGHTILLIDYYKSFTDLPGYPGTTGVLGDAIVDLDENHKPVWVWDAFDHLDVNRHPFLLPDWTHANSIVYSPDDGDLILSMRDQSWVVKIDYQNGTGSGNIVWRLGYNGDFRLTNGQSQDWFYGQHYANILSPNSTGTYNLMVFDDGDFRVLPPGGGLCGVPNEPKCYSRVPIYQIDENAMTATVVWQDNLSPVYTFWGGSAQQLPQGNVAFCLSAPSDDPMGGRYMEVTGDAMPQVVLQMEVQGQNAYRGVHVPSLYPGVQW